MFSISILLHLLFSDIYPGDGYAKNAITKEVHVTFRDTDAQYIRKARKAIEEVVELSRPDFIIYNAGTDCLHGDPLGSNYSLKARTKCFEPRNN